VEALGIAAKIKQTLDELTKAPEPPKDLGSDDESEMSRLRVLKQNQIIYMVEMRSVSTGGLSALIVRDEKAMDLLRQPVYESDSQEIIKELCDRDGKFKWKLKQIELAQAEEEDKEDEDEDELEEESESSQRLQE